MIDECPACEGQTFRPFAMSGGLQIVRCKSCSLIFSNPRIPETQTRRFFEDEYLREASRIEDDMTKYRAGSLARTAARLKARYPNGGRLLDVGTASGLFLSHFAGHEHWEAEGLEPSRQAAVHASNLYRVPVHRGFLDTVELPTAAYDAVTILDAFFLDPHPGRSLATIHRILKPGGTVWLDIPGLNFRMLKNTGFVSRLLYGVWAQLNPAMQMFYYEERTLSRLMRRHGFSLAARFPEQSPLYGGSAKRLLNNTYFNAASILYKATAGRLNIAPKELLVYSKGSS